MRRACEIRTAGSWNAATAIDRVVLDAHERHRRRIALTGEGGTAFLLDLPQATPLKDGDGLVLEDMLRRLCVRLTSLEAPFDPEHGSYVHASNHDHEH